jgi:hypothetical protein
MTVLDFIIGLIGVLSVVAVIGVLTQSHVIVIICAAGAAVGSFGVVWAWLASHKIYVLPPFIWTKVSPRPPKDRGPPH